MLKCVDYTNKMQTFIFMVYFYFFLNVAMRLLIITWGLIQYFLGQRCTRCSQVLYEMLIDNSYFTDEKGK